MISNPCSWFVTGYDQEEFVYEGGEHLYHFSPADNGLTNVMECNVVFFADDYEHALDVLRRMFETRIAAATSHIEHKRGDSMGSAELKSREYVVRDKYQGWLEALNAGEIKLMRAARNHFYKVGWASNDTV